MLDVVFFRTFFEMFCGYIDENKDYLTELDSAIGDADHGINMEKGCKNAMNRVDNVEFKKISDLLKTISVAMMSSVGGASGPLYGTVFMKMSLALNKDTCTLEDLSKALRGALDGIKVLGKASVGDKTMVDVWEPVVNEFEKEIENGNVDNKTLVDVAKVSMEKTTPLIAKKGRASYLGKRSIGHQDPGATSSYLFFKALFEGLKI